MKATTRFWVFLALGMFFLIPTFFFAVGLALVAQYGEGYINSPGAGPLLAVCTLGLGLPAILFFWLMVQEARALRVGSAPPWKTPVTSVESTAPPVRFCRRCGARVQPIPDTNEFRCESCGNVQILGA